MVETDPSLLDRPARNWLAYAVETEIDDHERQRQNGSGDIEVLNDGAHH